MEIMTHELLSCGLQFIVMCDSVNIRINADYSAVSIKGAGGNKRVGEGQFFHLIHEKSSQGGHKFRLLHEKMRARGEN